MRKLVLYLFFSFLFLFFALPVQAQNTASISITECAPDSQGNSKPVLKASWNLTEGVSSPNQCNIYVRTPYGDIPIDTRCEGSYKSDTPGYVSSRSNQSVPIVDGGRYDLYASTGTFKPGGGYIEEIRVTESVPQYCSRIPSNRTPTSPTSGGISNIEQVFGKIIPPSFVQNIGTGEQGISRIITTIINIIYTIAAIAFIFMIIWSAWQWITSGGEKDKVAAARQRFTYAIIGVVILALAGLIITILGEITGFKFFS